jgi:hypothetical protein
MKRTHTSAKQKKRHPKLVKSVESQEASSVSDIGILASVENTLKKLNPDTYKYRENKKYNKQIAEIRQSQEQFYNSVVLTSVFLNIFSGNPDEFQFLLSNEIIERYQFEKAWENPEWVWESIDEMTNDMAFGNKYFTYTGNGLFITLQFTSKKKAMKIDDIIRGFSGYMGGEWGI